MNGGLIQGLPDELAFDCLIRLPFHSFAAARSVAKRWRKELDSPYFHALRRSRGLASAVVVFVQADPCIAGTDPANKYSACAPTYRLNLHEPATGSWSSLPPIPSLPHGLPLFCRIAAAGHQLVVIGGWDSKTWVVSNAVYIYDFAAGTWRSGNLMPGPERSFFGCAAGVAGDRTVVLVAGGHDEEKTALTSVLAYDVSSDEWSELPDMACERDECHAVFSHGQFHVIGGYPTENQGQFSGSREVFDIATWTWGPVMDDVEESQLAEPKRACASEANEAVTSQRVAGRCETDASGCRSGGWRYGGGIEYTWWVPISVLSQTATRYDDMDEGGGAGGILWPYSDDVFCRALIF